MYVHCSQHWNFNGPRDGCVSLRFVNNQKPGNCRASYCRFD
jgi:hypothetical protein